MLGVRILLRAEHSPVTLEDSHPSFRCLWKESLIWRMELKGKKYAGQLRDSAQIGRVECWLPAVRSIRAP